MTIIATHGVSSATAVEMVVTIPSHQQVVAFIAV